MFPPDASAVFCVTVHLLAQGLRRLFLLCGSLLSLVVVVGGGYRGFPLSQSVAAAILHTPSKDYSMYTFP